MDDRYNYCPCGEKCNLQLDKGLHIYVWNGKNENGADVVSGVYFVQLLTNKSILSHKIILLK